MDRSLVEDRISREPFQILQRDAAFIGFNSVSTEKISNLSVIIIEHHIISFENRRKSLINSLYLDRINNKVLSALYMIHFPLSEM